MVDETLTAALEREHHEIDAGLLRFRDGLGTNESRPDDLTRAAEALRRHIYLEEEFLFPPLRTAGLLPPVLVMLREHGEIWRTLDDLQSVDPTSDPGEAGQRCDRLLALLADHNAKEEPIIYPQGDRVLTDEARRDLQAFIETGEMPEGWVCSQG